MSPKIKVYGSALALFLAGAVAGGFGSELAARGQSNPGDGGPSMGREGGSGGMHHGQMGEKIQEHLTKKLNLTSDQQEQLRQILASSKPQFQEMRERHEGERRDLMKSVGDKIRNILNADQQKQFDELRQKMKDRMEHRAEGGDGDGHQGRGFFKRGGGFRGQGM